ncbi:uncharacterized protein LOC134155294 [Pezoporus occidentalis]|uniref:uncharacterized protein LOC134155294 n=1 Tax=Pezoporus occidentalis TaxID=407982 RepID=UPI002F90C448
MSLPAPGEVWWQAPALSLYVFTSRRRKAGRRRRGASALSREAGGEETYRSRLAGLPAACLPPAVPTSSPGCRGFFGKHGSACAFCQLRAPVTLIVASVQRDKNLIGELWKARCQQVTPPSSGLKSAFKGPRSKHAASRPETMSRSRGKPKLAHVFSFFLLLIRGNTFIRLPRHFPPARFISCDNRQGWKAPGELRAWMSQEGGMVHFVVTG